MKTMTNNFEITKDDLLKLKEYEDNIDHIYMKIKHRIQSIFEPKFYTYIDCINLLQNDNIMVFVTERYQGMDNPNTFEIPLSALKTKQTFEEWMKEEEIKIQNKIKEDDIKEEQEEIEQEKKQYELLKAKYGNNS